MPYATPEQYVEFEVAASSRHEYIHGEIVPRGERTLRQALIAANFLSAVHKFGLVVFSSDLRSAVKDAPRENPRLPDTLQNPTFILDVLTPFRRTFASAGTSLTEFILFDEAPVEIEHYRRLANGHWDLATIRERDAVLTLESVQCDLPVAEIYRGLEMLDDPGA